MWGKIEKIMTEKGLNKHQLTMRAGLNWTCLTDLKMGRKKSMKFDDMVKIADVLEVSLDVFRD